MTNFIHLKNSNEIINTNNLLSVSITRAGYYCIKLVYEAKTPCLVSSALNQYEYTYNRFIEYCDEKKRDEDFDQLKMICS